MMISQDATSPSVSEICANVKHLGFAASKFIRLYGEDFEVVSDPFPEAGGIAVRVKAKRDSSVRVLRLPATILQGTKSRVTNAA
jgi:hypothetical protein